MPSSLGVHLWSIRTGSRGLESRKMTCLDFFEFWLAARKRQNKFVMLESNDAEQLGRAFIERQDSLMAARKSKK